MKKLKQKIILGIVFGAFGFYACDKTTDIVASKSSINAVVDGAQAYKSLYQCWAGYKCGKVIGITDSEFSAYKLLENEVKIEVTASKFSSDTVKIVLNTIESNYTAKQQDVFFSQVKSLNKEPQLLNPAMVAAAYNVAGIAGFSAEVIVPVGKGTGKVVGSPTLNKYSDVETFFVSKNGTARREIVIMPK